MNFWSSFRITLYVGTLFLAQVVSAQSSTILNGKTVDSTGRGITAVVSLYPARTENRTELARTSSTVDGSFHITVQNLPDRVVVEATTPNGLSGHVEIDAAAVLASRNRPVIVRINSAHMLTAVNVRAHFQRRPSVFNFFEGEPSTRVEPTGPATSNWLDPLDEGSFAALLGSSPEILIAGDGTNSAMGAPGASNQLQIGGMRVPSGLVAGQLNGTLSVSPWDATIGGAAGATVNLLMAPASKYSSTYAFLRSGIAGVPSWAAPKSPTHSATVPAQFSAGATGPLGRFGYRVNVFTETDAASLPQWDRSLGSQQRQVIDSLATLLEAPGVRTIARNTQAGIIGRLDVFPFDDNRVLALTSALTRTTRNLGLGAVPSTGSAGTKSIEDAGLLQLESTRVIGERVLWTSLFSTSLTENKLDRIAAAPTVLVTDNGVGNIFVAGGAIPQPSHTSFAAEARSTATWYSTDNSIRYVAQLQVRGERARIDAQGPHGIFTTSSIAALSQGTATSLDRIDATDAASASSVVFAPALSARYDVGKNGSLLLGLRTDAWTTSGIADGRAPHYIDVSPRLAFLRRLGPQSSHKSPFGTLRIGAGRFTDWPGIEEWSDAWQSGGATREICTSPDVPPIMITVEAPQCGSGNTQALGRTVGVPDLRPPLSDRVDVSLAITQIVPGVRGELGAAFAHNSRIPARISPLSNIPIAIRLAGEDGRALLVPYTAIEFDGTVPPATIPSGTSDVTSLISGGTSDVSQWRFHLATRDPFARTMLDAIYTFTTGHERSLVIAPSTSAPTFVSGPLSIGGRHTFALSAGEWIGEAQIRVSAIVRSGVRFTPLADRDLNGDGQANDAAFVPQSESANWANTVSPGARSCVIAAAGHLAQMNSCTGPWTLSSFVLASIPGTKIGLPRGSSVEVQLSNPFGLAAGLGRQTRVTFGNGTRVDPILVHITGFDSTSRRFSGTPLSHFGEPLGVSSAVTEPIRVAVGVRVPLGVSVTAQRADVAMNTFQHDTSTRARQHAALEYLSDLPPIPLVVLQSGEALQLTATQRRTLQALGGRWQASAVGTVLSAVRSDMSGGDQQSTKERLVQARTAFLREASTIASEVRQLLTADQIDELPDGVQRLLNPRFLKFLADQDAATS